MSLLWKIYFVVDTPLVKLIQCKRCIFSKKKKKFELEILLTIPASNDDKSNRNNSAGQGWNVLENNCMYKYAIWNRSQKNNSVIGEITFKRTDSVLSLWGALSYFKQQLQNRKKNTLSVALAAFSTRLADHFGCYAYLIRTTIIGLLLWTNTENTVINIISVINGNYTVTAFCLCKAEYWRHYRYLCLSFVTHITFEHARGRCVSRWCDIQVIVSCIEAVALIRISYCTPLRRLSGSNPRGTTTPPPPPTW